MVVSFIVSFRRGQKNCEKKCSHEQKTFISGCVSYVDFGIKFKEPSQYEKPHYLGYSQFCSRPFFSVGGANSFVDRWYVLGGVPKWAKNCSFHTFHFNAWRRCNNQFEIKKWYLIPMQKSKVRRMVLSITAQFWMLREILRVEVKNERFSLGFPIGRGWSINTNW